MQTDKLVLVTAGGGGDGQDLFDAMVRGLLDVGDQVDFDCLLIGGPLMEEAHRTDLRRQIGDQKNLHFLDFASQMTSYLRAADAVVSMGGYNSVCEILSSGRPAIIVPRVNPRKEQLIRAEVLSRRGIVEMIHPNDLTPARLLDATRLVLSDARVVAAPVSMEGLPNVVSALQSLMPQLGRIQEPAAAPVPVSA